MPESERRKLEGSSEANEKTLESMIEVAKENEEIRGRITEMLLENMNKEEFKKRLIEEALKDKELRDKIMLEIIRKL